MNQRYTTKVYATNRTLDQEIIDDLTEILHLSPSSINSQPWHFTIVSDPELKARLGESSYFNENKIKQCQLLVVFSAVSDTTYFENELLTQLPQGAIDYYNSVLKPQGDKVVLDWFARQVYLSVGILLGACAKMKLDSSPMEGIDSQSYQQILGLTHHRPLVAVAVGYRDLSDRNHPSITPKSRYDKKLVITSI